MSEELQITPIGTTKKLSGMFKEWFLDYSSYVILERAVPAIEDGLKPVQRRILHALKELDDGRFNKVANVVGHTMQYHPHGDASIADAIVQLGQKNLLIETQGNWGNILTGDAAAASRYIEARLSKFALEIMYSPKITKKQLSYDGRKQEPIHFPVKFPLLLAQGTEGIAVGLSTKILPHNFVELLQASIAYLKGEHFELYPDFPTAGIIDVSGYNNGKRGGKVRVRAKITQVDKSTLCINEIPYSTTTSSLIKSILKANEKGKIKIKKIEDNTAANVEILIHLPTGISPDKTIDALYAFTSCEVSISPLSCVIENNNTPVFLSVDDILKHSTDRTVSLLKQELEIKLEELSEQWHFASLERIFIENRIYRSIEEVETWEGVIQTIDKELKPFISHLKRAVTEEDIIRLTEIQIKRISRFDLDKAQQHIEALSDQIAQVKKNLGQIIDFSINYFQQLIEKYGTGRERKTEIRPFDDIEATKVVIRNEKLYANKAEGFVGTSLKKDEYICDCSDIDDIIVFTEDGKMTIQKVSEKSYFGKNIIHTNVFKKNDNRTIYNMIYLDGKSGTSYVKRFNVTAITRDKIYNLIGEHPASKVLYFTANPNGEAEIVSIFLDQVGSIKKLKWDLDFASVLIKGRNAMGNIVSKYPIKKILLKEKGISTLQPRNIWFDSSVKRLNTDGRGTLLGDFKGDDRILIVQKNGVVKTIAAELSTHFEDDFFILEKWIYEKPISAVYFEGEKNRCFVKRFKIENKNREENIIGDHPKSELLFVSTEYYPVIQVVFDEKTNRENLRVELEQFIAVKGIKALGNQLTTEGEKIREIIALPPIVHQQEQPLTEVPPVYGQTQIHFEDENI